MAIVGQKLNVRIRTHSWAINKESKIVFQGCVCEKSVRVELWAKMMFNKTVSTVFKAQLTYQKFQKDCRRRLWHIWGKDHNDIDDQVKKAAGIVEPDGRDPKTVPGVHFIPLKNVKKQVFKATTDNVLRAGLSGFDLLLNNDVNKGLAFTKSERALFRLHGLLPPGQQSQAHQVHLLIKQIRNLQDELNKYLLLRSIEDSNKHLFYALLQTYPEELMPIIYTPVVGKACLYYSKLFLRPRGMYITIDDRGNVARVFDNWPMQHVKAIVVTDGERTLGLGDLGANAMAISVGKLFLYSAIGGIQPHLTLPICIDAGTNNERLLNDPYYIGLRRKRATPEELDQLLDEFMHVVADRYGQDCLIQFEDFGNNNARRLLEKYRDHYCTFNDDIQGTAAVAVAGIIASGRVTGKNLSQNVYLFQGAGSAATGIADLLVAAMINEGLTEHEARERIFICDINGLITEDCDFEGNAKVYAKKSRPMQVIDVIQEFQPSVLIGVSTAGGSFTPEIIRLMAKNHKVPVIFALSNPTAQSECTAEDAIVHSNGTCLFASGSPFAPVQYDGYEYQTSQGNNAYIFPALALSVITCGVRRITDEAFLMAAQALAAEVTDEELETGRLFPSLKRIRQVTTNMAASLVEYFYDEELGHNLPEPFDKKAFIKSVQYNVHYDDSLRYYDESQ